MSGIGDFSRLRALDDSFIPCSACGLSLHNEVDLDYAEALDKTDYASEFRCGDCGEPLPPARIAALVAERASLPNEALSWLETYRRFKASLRSAVRAHECVETPFGLFWGTHHADQVGRNPQTGGDMVIGGGSVVSFVPSAPLVADVCPSGLTRADFVQLVTERDGGVWDVERDDLADIGVCLELRPATRKLDVPSLYEIVCAELRDRRSVLLGELGELRVSRVRAEDIEGDLLYFRPLWLRHVWETD